MDYYTTVRLVMKCSGKDFIRSRKSTVKKQNECLHMTEGKSYPRAREKGHENFV